MDGFELEKVYETEIREELSRYARGEMIPQIDELINDLETISVHSILSAFGLEGFNDHTGGNVTTIHNFENGIVADRDIEALKSYEKPYKSAMDRHKYETVHREKREAYLSKGIPKSGYTGKEITTKSNAHLEHIVPVAEIEGRSDFFLFLTPEERVNLPYLDENLTLLEGNINKSKNKYDLLVWMNTVANGQTEPNRIRYGIDEKKVKELYQKAHQSIDVEIHATGFVKQTKEVAYEGMRAGIYMSVREALIAVLLDFTNEAFYIAKTLYQRYQNGEIKQNGVIGELQSSFDRLSMRIASNIEYYGEVAKDGTISGFLSRVMEFLINQCVTTAKYVVRLIRESIYAIIRIIKISSDNTLSVEERQKQMVQVLVSAVNICIVALLADYVSKCLSGVPYAQELGYAFSGIITGIASVIIIYVVNKGQQELLATTAAVADTSAVMIETIDGLDILHAERKNELDRLTRQADDLSELPF